MNRDLKSLITLLVLLFFIGEIHAITIYARNDGDWDQGSRWSTVGTGGANCNCTPGAGDDVIIDGYQIDIDANTGNVTANSVTIRSDDRDDNARLRVQGGAILTITGDLTIFGDRSSRDQTLLIEDASRINVGDDFIVNIDSGDDLFIDVDDSGQLNISDDFTIDKDGGDDIDIHINANSGSSGQIDVDGDFDFECDGSSDAAMEILVDDASSLFNVDGNMIVDLDGGNDDSELELNLDNGDFIVDGYMSLSRSGAFGNIDINADGGDITCDSVSVSSGGTISGSRGVRFYLDESTVMDVTNGMSVSMTSADDFYIYVNDNAGSDAEFNVGNDLTITRSNGDDIQFRVDDDNSVFSVGGDLTITSTGGEEIEFLLDNDATMTISGDLTITHSAGQTGEIELAGGGDDPLLAVGGDMTVTYSGGNDLFILDLNGGEVTVGGDMALSNTGSGNDVHVDMDGGDLTVTGDFDGNLTGNDELLIDIDGASAMSVGGNMELDISGGNDIELHLGENTTATSSLTVTGNLTLDHNGNTGGDDIQFLINDDCVVNVGGNFTMDTDGSGSAGNFYCRMFNSALLNIDGNFVMNSTASGYLEVTLNNSSEIEIAGNFVRQAAANNFGLLTCNGSSTIEYNGSSAQIFAEDAGAGTDGFTYENVIINNTSGTAPQITMEGEATINGSITFTDGVIASTTSDILVIADGATVSSASNASFVDGPVRKAGNEAFTFPVGDDDYRAISITAPSAATDTFDAQYFATDPDGSYSRSSLGAGMELVSQVEYWELNRGSTSSASVTVTLTWDASSAVGDLSDLLVAHWDGSQWTSEGNGSTTGNTTSGTIQTGGAVSSFSPFTLGSSSTNNPLPIELISFDGHRTDDGVYLNWSTASEINNDYFTLYRSVDGVDFAPIAHITGAGNSTRTIHYQHVDVDHLTGVVYYQLEQTDFDGTSWLSQVVDIEFDSQENVKDFVVYPNPFRESFQLSGLPDNAQHVQIVNATGSVVWQSGVETQIRPRLTQPGVYVMLIEDANGTVLGTSRLIYNP